MKTTLNYLIVILFGLPIHAPAQDVNIPDPYFKLKVLNHNPVIDANSDGQIQIAEAQAFFGTLNLTFTNGDPGQISDITGLEAFINIEGLEAGNNAIQTMDLSSNTALKVYNASGNPYTTLDFSSNPLLEFVQTNFGNLESVDFSNNPNLTWIHIQGNQLTALDISGNPLIEGVMLSDNPIASVDVTNNPMLRYFYCRGLNLNTLDVSSNPILVALDCQDNPQLTYINLKNGNNQGLNLSGTGATCEFYDLPSLETVCLDELNSPLSTYILNHVGHEVTFLEECLLGIDTPHPNSVQLYPNPVKNILNVQTAISVNEYKIYNTSGKLVKSGNIQGNHSIISLETLFSGLYFIQFTTNQEEYSTYKFIKI